MTLVKPWRGRFSETTSSLVEEFTASVAFDQRLYQQDIRGSLAHARMLEKIGVLSQAECHAIVQGLEQIQREIEAGEFQWALELEDVHMNIEARLIARIGEAGKKLHTGRSRNDQVATDTRLYVRDELDQVDKICLDLQKLILERAEREAETVMPGFTHLQTAQPVTLGHHLLAWFEMLRRDRARFADCRKRVDVMPLGAAALAGTSYPIDRQFCAAQLGFAQVAENSLDAVSDRDFALELAASASILMVHLSRWSEELILWSSAPFDFISLPDRLCTGSSIMPQKKNPDVPELIRGKSGRVIGNLMSLLTLMKAQPLAYNKDNQEDKEPLFDTLDTIQACVRLMGAIVPQFVVKPERMRAAASRGYATATDLADYLVRKGIPFRDAHEMVGQLVQLAITRDIELAALPLADLQAVCSHIAPDVYQVLTLEGSVAARDHLGGTAPRQVRAAIARARQNLA